MAVLESGTACYHIALSAIHSFQGEQRERPVRAPPCHVRGVLQLASCADGLIPLHSNPDLPVSQILRCFPRFSRRYSGVGTIDSSNSTHETYA